MHILPEVLITSVGSGVGYGVLYSLRRADRPYRILGASAMAVAAGNFRCDAVYHLPGADRPEQYLEGLLAILDREHPHLVMPGHDMELPLLAARRDEIERGTGTKVLVSAPEVIRVCNDKYESARFFGDRFAATALAPEQIRQLVADCGFPLVVKPRYGYASRGVQVVFDVAELNAALRSGKDTLVVQEFLPPAGLSKPRQELTRMDVYEDRRLLQEEEYSVQVLVGRSGQVLGLFSSRNSLWHGIPFTIETYRDPSLEVQVIEMTQRLADMGLMGPCNFQARKTATGGYRFFEVNARFTGITPVRADMRFNECDACYRHFVEADDHLNLACPEGLWAQRYIAHDVFTREDVAALVGTGRWPAST